MRKGLGLLGSMGRVWGGKNIKHIIIFAFYIKLNKKITYVDVKFKYKLCISYFYFHLNI